MRRLSIPILVFFSFLTFLLLTVFCVKHNDHQNETNIPIVAELPILYQGCNLKTGQNILIKDQNKFDSILVQSVIDQYSILQNIDFSIYDVILISDVYTHGIDKIEQKLIKTNDSTFIFKVKVFYLLTLPAGNFYCGAIVNKFPANAKIQVDISKIN